MCIRDRIDEVSVYNYALSEDEITDLYQKYTKPSYPAEKKVLAEFTFDEDVYKRQVIDLTNPSNLPDPSEIEYMEEPMVSAEIMVTSEYVGAIMKLCQERRGIYISMEYIEETRALIKYDLPLNEIIYDFFDALISCICKYEVI